MIALNKVRKYGPYSPVLKGGTQKILPSTAVEKKF